MIIVDFSQVAISIATTSKVGSPDSKNPQSKGLFKHEVLAALLSYKKKFSSYGKMVIAIDGGNYWRKSIFPFYKQNRNEAKEKSDLDWAFIYQCLNELIDDLRTHFPYKIVGGQNAEADDVIAVLTSYLQTHELDCSGVFDDLPQPVMIVSGDGDFIQLQRYKNVRQWSPRFQEFVLPKVTLHEYITEHIVKGDGGDGIPNILSADNSLVDHIRQKAVKKERLEEFIALGIDACKNEEERAKFLRNQTLVDFRYIPDDIAKKIINNYEACMPVTNKNAIVQYFMVNKMKLLLAEASSF